MKKQFTPIAMKCNKEQFEAIKPKLEKSEFEINIPYSFDFYQYLCNKQKEIRNFSVPDSSRIFYETWNERIFLEACGIEIEETFEITKETILKYKMKDEFPEVFEVKLEVGKWYKRPRNKALFFIVGDPKITPFEVYGFDDEGGWMNVENARTLPDYEIEATEQEVFEALKNEAVKRYENKFINPINANIMHDYNNKGVLLELNKSSLDADNRLWCGCGQWNAIVFDNGQWAKIIPTKTKEEAEKLLNCKIIS